MTSRRDILGSRKALLLGGALLVATVSATGALAADQMPVKAASVSVDTGWYSYGSIEAGSNIFLQKPGNGFGKTSADPFWLTPNTTKSNAKMDEYGKVPRGPFGEVEIHAGSRDGRVALDIWADNIGYDNQRYQFYIYEPGRQYFNMGWDQTPHLLSSSAKSIYGGVGSTRLTVDPVSRAFLQANSFPANTQPQRNCIEAYIDGLANPGGCAGVFPATGAPIANIELKTLREKFTVGYRNTMVDGWDFNADYSNEHRTGMRPLGIGFGIAAAINPRPSTGAVEVPQPIDDRTQNVAGAGEYVGMTPWGTRFNTSVKYSGSFFNNNNKSMDVDNPFCTTCSAVGPAPFGASLLRYGLAPNNNANGVTWNASTDIPIFQSRFTSNMQYMSFRQNDPFIDTATNGLTNGPLVTQVNPYPASSLNGEVNAFLTNNVLYSHLTSNLTNTAKVRYYDRKDNTPTLVFTNYAFADGGVTNTQPLTRDPHSYTKLNIEDGLKWEASRAWTFGLSGLYERYTFANGEVDATKEFGGKAFVNWTPWSYLTARSSIEYSQRRYDNWLAASADPAAAAMRYFFVMNRDRTKGSTIVEMQVFKNVTLSPNGGFRWDNYPGDQVLSGNAASALVLPLTDSLGTKYDRSWNVGSDLGVRVNPQLRFNFGYNYEEHYLKMISCCGGAAATVPFNTNDEWSSKITQRYHTFLAATEWKAIPGKLDFKADYLISFSNEANNTTPCPANNNSCTGNNSAGPTFPWPDERNIFQRFSILAKYYVDPSYVKQMGWFGNVTVNARYTLEANKNSNWATDNFSPYSPSAADAGGVDISNGGRSLFLAYNNPNYIAQIVTASINWKW